MKCALKPAFSFGFSHRLVKNSASIGVFDDDRRSQLVAGTVTNKVVLQNSDSIFHVNEAIYCLEAVRFTSSDETDVILIGSASALTCYDIYNNKTVFHRDTPEGIRCILVGTVDDYKSPVIICGCGTTIWGVDPDGKDLFWTALGDEVNTLALCDVDKDGRNELVIGTDGLEIKIFKHMSLYKEITEGDPVIALTGLGNSRFAYGCANGTLGIFENGERLWRIKSKQIVISILSFPSPDSITTVWQNGKVDVRQVDNGEVIGRELLEGDVCTAFLSSLYDNSRQQVTVVFSNGQVRGLEVSSDDQVQSEDAQKIIREFGLRKHNLLEELKNYEKTDHEEAERSQIPANTQLDCNLDLSLEKGLCLQLVVTNAIPIRSAVIFAEGVFRSESYVIHPNFIETSELAAYICPGKDMMTDLHIKVLVGHSYAKQLHVFEVTKVLPRFSTYLYVDKLKDEPQSYVEFNVGFRPDNLKLMDWFLINFILSEDVLSPHFEEAIGEFCISFMCMRNHEGVVIEISPKGECVIRHNDIDSCGGLLQSLVESLGITELQSRANFPACLQIVQNIDEKYEMNDRLAAEWADKLNAVRETTVRAEDFLVLRNASNAKKLYVRMALLNREIVQQHAVRMNAREGLLDSLKLLNIAIEQNARLRVGTAASELIKECRKAIVTENILTLPKLLQYGV